MTDTAYNRQLQNSIPLSKLSQVTHKFIFLFLFMFNIQTVSAATYDELEQNILLKSDEAEKSQTYINNFNDFFDLNAQDTEESQKAAKTATEHLTNGFDLMTSGNITKAIEKFEQAWKLNPNLTSAGIILGLNHLQKKEYDQALAYADKITKIKPIKYNAIGHTLTGLTYSSQGLYDKAIKAFKRTLEYLPNEKNALYNMASIEAAQKNTIYANQYLDQILSIDRTNLNALNLKADIELKKSNANISKAHDWLQRAINNHPRSSKPLVTLATSYLALKRYEDIIQLTENSNSPVLIELRGKAFLNLQQIDKAQKEFINLTKHFPESAAAFFLLSEYYGKVGDITKMQTNMEQAIKLDPEFLPARIGQIKTLYYSKKIDQAEAASKKLFTDFGKIAKVYSIAGWLAYELSQFDQAETYFQQLHQLKANSETLLLLFQVKLAKNQNEQAFALIDNWIANHPDDKEIEITRADVLMASNQFDKAKESYLQIIKKFPNTAGAYNNLAWLTFKDDLKKAIRYAKKALSLEKNNPHILDSVAMMYLYDGNIDEAAKFSNQAIKLSNDPELLYHHADILFKNNQMEESAKYLDQILAMDEQSLNVELVKQVKKLRQAIN